MARCLKEKKVEESLLKQRKQPINKDLGFSWSKGFAAFPEHLFHPFPGSVWRCCLPLFAKDKNPEENVTNPQRGEAALFFDLLFFHGVPLIVKKPSFWLSNKKYSNNTSQPLSHLIVLFEYKLHTRSLKLKARTTCDTPKFIKSFHVKNFFLIVMLCACFRFLKENP